KRNTPEIKVTMTIAARTAMPFCSADAIGIRVAMPADNRARMGTIRSCGIAITAWHELVKATNAPTITAVVSAIRIPIGTRALSGPLKIREAKDAAAITVNTATTNPALAVTATCEKVLFLIDSSTANGVFQRKQGWSVYFLKGPSPTCNKSPGDTVK